MRERGREREREREREKKSWLEPELIVLVRSKPEEAVLSFCKTMFGATGSTANVEAACVELSCFLCDELSDS